MVYLFAILNVLCYVIAYFVAKFLLRKWTVVLWCLSSLSLAIGFFLVWVLAQVFDVPVVLFRSIYVFRAEKMGHQWLWAAAFWFVVALVLFFATRKPRGQPPPSQTDKRM